MFVTIPPQTARRCDWVWCGWGVVWQNSMIQGGWVTQFVELLLVLLFTYWGRLIGYPASNLHFEAPVFADLSRAVFGRISHRMSGREFSGVGSWVVCGQYGKCLVLATLNMGGIVSICSSFSYILLTNWGNLGFRWILGCDSLAGFYTIVQCGFWDWLT